ncbi:transposase [Paenibacillus yanchengensis]|uniref:Transposase n=1 Tax=Paenibacillus yanchengensis TaxID=2035833 RepID=A0ABW4YG33_9BACL
MREYELTSSALDRRMKQAQTTGSFKEKDNRSAEENELITLRKEIQQLKMENDILKQAALIMDLFTYTIAQFCTLIAL